MKFSSLLLSMGLLAFSLVSASAEPLLRYEFNQPGITQESTGSRSLSLTVKGANAEGQYVDIDYIGQAPKKRRGAVNSNVLNLTSSNVDTGMLTGAEKGQRK